MIDFITPEQKPMVVQLIVVCVTILLFGAFGGVSGGLYRYKCNHMPFINKKRDFFIFAFSGIACAFGVIVLCSGIGSIFSKSDIFSQGLYLIGISLVSGFFAMRLLPCLGNRLEKQINDINIKAEEASRLGHDAMTYQHLLSIAEMALSTKKTTELDDATAQLQNAVNKNDYFAMDRTINIYLGRLYRWNGNLNDAIYSLRKFIEKIEILKRSPRHGDCEAVAAAYFNIACYHVEKAKKCGAGSDERVRLLSEAKAALSESIKRKNSYRDDALVDNDLELFRQECPDFLG